MKRPVLCCICECPAVDGGVRVDQLDVEKLSEWWRRNIGVEFETSEKLETQRVVCEFCIWDARQEHEHTGELSDDDDVSDSHWWSGHDDNHFYYRYYYQEDTMKRCKVELEVLDINKLLSKICPSRANNDNSINVKVQFARTSSNGEEVFQDNTDNASKKKNHHEQGSFCILCVQDFSMSDALEQHLRKCHAGQFFWCKVPDCSRIFQTVDGFNDHRLKSHKRMKKCQFCIKTLCSTKMSRHLKKSHKSENLVRCIHHCGLYFRSKQEMKKHIGLAHTALMLQKCILCDTILLGNKMRYHLQISHKSQFSDLYECSFHCSKYFLTKKEQQEHIDCAHKKSYVDEEKFKCLYCKKLFFRKNNLQNHITFSHQKIKIQCNIHGCHQFFLTKNEQQEHIDCAHKKSYVDEEQFKCLYCKKLFFRKMNLQKHIKCSHQKTKIQCEVHGCRQFFLTQPQLNAHYRQTHQHIEETKMFQCSECEYKSAAKTNFLSHIAYKHGVKDKPCPRCGKLFSKYFILRAHVKLHDNIKTCQYCKSAIYRLKSHQKVEKCNNCKQLLFCSKVATLHFKQCHRR